MLNQEDGDADFEVSAIRGLEDPAYEEAMKELGETE